MQSGGMTIIENRAEKIESFIHTPSTRRDGVASTVSLSVGCSVVEAQSGPVPQQLMIRQKTGEYNSIVSQVTMALFSALMTVAVKLRLGEGEDGTYCGRMGVIQQSQWLVEISNSHLKCPGSLFVRQTSHRYVRRTQAHFMFPSGAI